MQASAFCASRPRDATRRMSATELVCAAPSQQRLRRSSVAAVLIGILPPSTQLRVPRSLLEMLPAAPRGGTRRHLEGGDARYAQHQLRRSSSNSRRRRQCPATIRQPLEWAAARRICHIFATVTYTQTFFVHKS